MINLRLIDYWFLLWKIKDNYTSDCIYYHALTIADEVKDELKAVNGL